MSKDKYNLRLCYNQIVPSVLPLDDYVSYYDLTAVLSGSFTYIINGTTYVLDPGDAIFIKPGDHRVRIPSDVTTHYVSINFFYNSEEKITFPTFLSRCLTSDVKSWMLALHQTTKDHVNTTIPEKQEHILQLILLSLQDAMAQSTQHPYLKTILRYINEHFTEKITLNDIAEHVSLTAPYCAYIVKKEFGKTIFDIILNERLALAKTYILQGEKGFSEICHLCGFNDYGYFSRFFKKATGLSPSQYRKLK